MLKICTSCKINKSTLFYYKNKNMKDGLAYICKSCAKAYKINNKDHINKLRREKYNKNPSKYRQQTLKSHKKNRSKRLEKQKIYYKNNKDYFSFKSKQYRENNIDSILLRNRKRKNQINQSSIISQNEINQLLKKHEYNCFYCKVEVKRGINLHLDHKVPLSRGGLHRIDNLAPSCSKCNLQKGTFTSEEFLRRKMECL